MIKRNQKRKTKVIPLILSFIMILTLIPTAYAVTDTASLFVWDGSISAKFDSGVGSADAPYIVRTAEQLAYFAYLVNSGDDFSGKYVKLDADLKLNDTSELQKWGEHPEINYTFIPKNTWSSIGSKDKPFNGSFDGNGHTIYGIFILSNKDYVGLFGCTGNSAAISNLNIRDSYICGNDYVGSVSGFNGGSAIGCTSNATVTGEKNIGGICGFNTGAISKCINSGKVYGNDNIGGISNVVTSTDGNAVIDRCFNSGNISADNILAGGILGMGYVGYGTSLDISDCYNTGNITAKMDVGGIVGMTYIEQGKCNISRVYNVGDVSGDSLVGEIVGCKDNKFSNISAEIKNCYYLIKDNGDYQYGVGHYSNEKPIVDNEGEINRLTHELFTVKNNFAGFDFDNVWTMKSFLGYSYPTLQGLGYENLIREIQIITLPKNLKLTLGDELDLTGLMVAVKDDSGEAFTITDYEISGYDSSKPGEQEVIVSYGKCLTSFKVFVEKLTVEPPETTASVYVITDSSVILVPVDGCEYRMDDGQWQKSNVFTDLQPNSTHTFYLRFMETETTQPSEENEGIEITTLKQKAENPQVVPEVLEVTDRSIVLEKIEGYEYRINDEPWQNSSVFNNLSPDTQYTVYYRIAETGTTYASKESVGIAVSTEKMLGDVDNDKKVTMVDVVMLQRYIASLTVLTPEQIRLADVNRDTEITMLDVTTIQKYIAGIIEKF
ncbi:MAG: bacterial Ig-like domain-containing protein [Clostridiales bacterium]|nr:bacterial Ig-like domain-containing protein [Clostridiales bacterium]